ncbi:MAG: hypothetical protein KJ566_01530 [Nanoarchaeota archaeon]|nr:hypothetical protein [Nanoarchaeota archaeon]
MDLIKESFFKVKADIGLLKSEMNNLKNEISETKKQMTEICEILLKILKKEDPTQKKDNQTTSTQNQTTPAHNLPFRALRSQNNPFSTGNEGASTDRQTHQQTDRHTFFHRNSIENASEIIDSLDNIKKDLRQKFKQLTEQEFFVFSTIYQLDEEIGHSNYKILSQRLKLTESSIRDYVTRIIKKGIPIDKTRINNKTINLTISQNLKKMASLSTLLQLRGI